MNRPIISSRMSWHFLAGISPSFLRSAILIWSSSAFAWVNAESASDLGLRFRASRRNSM